MGQVRSLSLTGTLRFAVRPLPRALGSQIPVEALLHNQLIEDIYRHICLPKPKEIVQYSSLHEAFSDFEYWSKRIEKVMPCFWSYQFPMVIPDSYWARFQLEKDGYRLNIKRTPNEYGCFVYSQPIEVSPANGMNQAIYADTCEQLSLQAVDNTVDELVSNACEKYETEVEHLQGLMAEEDPTCQMGVEDFIFLGNFSWLQKELWMLNRCKNSYGIPINESMLDTLSRIRECERLFLTFSNMVVIAAVN